LKVPFLELKAQYQGIKAEVDEAMARVVGECGFIGGAEVKGFEEAFAAYLGASSCIGVGNGTDALEIALEALELPAGSEVIVPANSFIATSEAVTRSGLRVVFCDCDPETYTLSISDAASKITPATKAIIPVHLYGQPCDMEGVRRLADSHGLKVIEDCAQAHGATFHGKRIGTLGDVAAFSFYPGKNLGAYGDGGAMVTSNEELATRCRMIANHGRISKYDHEFEGRNSRLDALQAAVLRVKLGHLEEWTESRRRNAARYTELLQGMEVVTPVERPGLRHVYHLYVVRVEERDRVQARLKEAGIETGVHYPIPLPFLQAYRRLGHREEDFPVAAAYHGKLLSLPMFPELSGEQIERVCEALRQAL
jgi:dTDP-4-amino-4,6-dideoxygalactose transaminase